MSHFLSNIWNGNVGALELILIVAGFAMVARSVWSMVQRTIARRSRPVFTGTRRSIDKSYERGALRLANGDAYEGSFDNGSRMHGLGMHTYGAARASAKLPPDASDYAARIDALLEQHAVDSVQRRATRDAKYAALVERWRALPATTCVYVGDFNAGRAHGVGRERYADGSVYEGAYLRGERSGLGALVYASLSYAVYVGEWRRNKKHGRARFYFANGDVYEGEFADGKRHGRGTQTPSGDGVPQHQLWKRGQLIVADEDERIVAQEEREMNG